MSERPSPELPGPELPSPERPVADWLSAQLDEHLATAGAMAALAPAVRSVAQLLCDAFGNGGILYSFGNGGSTADAQHLTGEMIGHYKRERRPLAAVTLGADVATMSCIANDYAYEDVFARQLQALARPGDVAAAFSTSGTSPNITRALQAARANGAATVLFGGGEGGTARGFADHALLVPSRETGRIQEMHAFLVHAVSGMVDAWAAGGAQP